MFSAAQTRQTEETVRLEKLGCADMDNKREKMLGYLRNPGSVQWSITTSQCASAQDNVY